MALTNSATGNNGTYISLKKGYWARRAEENELGAVSRKRGGTQENADEIVWEFRYDTLVGKIVNAYIDKGNYGNNLMLELEDNGERFLAMIKSDGALGESVIKTLPNIDLSKPVVFKAYVNKKDRGALWIEQDKQGVKWAYTKEAPNGIPQPTSKTVKGEQKWDFSEVENFLYEKMVEWCSQFEGKKDDKSGFVVDKDREATEDDLPF